MRKAPKQFVVLAVLVTAATAAGAVARQDPALEGPPFLEGAWYGMTRLPGLGEFPSLDTFTTNVRAGSGGSAHCTIPAASSMSHPEHPTDPEFWLDATSSAHGNWVRIGTNTYAATLVRAITDQNGSAYGWIQQWGTLSPSSENEFTGTLKVQFFRLDGTPYSPVFTGTLHRKRVEIITPGE